jgi:16S rRNA (cytosine967-C5)-methyltransferase
VPPETLPGWRAGAVAVQDGAAQLAVEALAITAGERVLDACAAPGGKCAQLAARIGAEGSLLALDVDERRLRRVRATLRRLQLEGENVELLAADAMRPGPWAGERRFDAGAARRAVFGDRHHPSPARRQMAPARRRHSRAGRAAGADARCLWTLLAPDGRLLYATCSLLKDENERQVAAFLARTPDARAQPLDERFGRASGAGRQRLPGEDGMDGFFYALLRKD